MRIGASCSPALGHDVLAGTRRRTAAPFVHAKRSWTDDQPERASPSATCPASARTRAYRSRTAGARRTSPVSRRLGYARHLVRDISPGGRRSRATMSVSSGRGSWRPWRGPKPPPVIPSFPVELLGSSDRRARPCHPFTPLCIELPPSTIMAGRVAAVAAASAVMRYEGEARDAARHAASNAARARRAPRSRRCAAPRSRGRAGPRHDHVHQGQRESGIGSGPEPQHLVRLGGGLLSSRRWSLREAPRRRAAASGARYWAGWRVRPERISAACSPMSSCVHLEHAGEPEAEGAEPQQMMVGFHHWQP